MTWARKGLEPPKMNLVEELMNVAMNEEFMAMVGLLDAEVDA